MPQESPVLFSVHTGKVAASIKLLVLLLFLLTTTATMALSSTNIHFDLVFACGRIFRKSPDNEPFNSDPGQYLVPCQTSIITLADGQCFLQINEAELRLKQETILSLIATHSFELRQGLAGFKAGSEKLMLNTAHLKVEFADAIVVIKTNSALTRVCVVKGKVAVMQGKLITDLIAGQEIAAAPQRLSKAYKQSDELRFSWYWVSADKEPAFQ